MKKLFALILSVALVLSIAAPVLAVEMWPGYPGPDELEVIETLPNPFKFWKVENDPDGDGYVTDVDNWADRKAEIRDMFQHYWYGYKWPTAAEDVRGGAVANMVDNNQTARVSNNNVSLNLNREFYKLVNLIKAGTVEVAVAPTEEEPEPAPLTFGPAESDEEAIALAVAAFNAGYRYVGVISVSDGCNTTNVNVDEPLKTWLNADLAEDLSNLPAEQYANGYATTIFIENPELGTKAKFNISVSVPSAEVRKAVWGDENAQCPVVLGPGVFAQSTLLANGYATATYNTGDIYPDAEGSEGVYGADQRRGVYTTLYPYDLNTYEYCSGFQMACAWAVSQMITAFENPAIDNDGNDLDITFGEQIGIDPTRTAVTGHSRNGQGSIVSAAFDDRISIALPSEPACGSFRYKVEGKIFNFNTSYYPSANRVYGKTGPASNGLGGSWFSGKADMFKYDFPDCDREMLLPMDPGEMIACIAPRPYYILNGIHNHWQGNEGIVSIVQVASEVYDFIGKDEIEKNNIAVNVRESSHSFYYTFDVPFALAILDREWKQKDQETGEYIDPILHVRDLTPSTSGNESGQNITYPAKDYQYISEFTSYPFELASSYINWSSPLKYMLWTSQDNFLIERDVTIEAHSDAPDVKLITPAGKVIDASAHEGEIFTFELAAEDNAYGRYELATAGDEKDNRSVFFAAISVADALRHGTTKGDEGEENRVLGFSSRLGNTRQDPPVVYINGEATDMNFTPNRMPKQETTLFGYGIQFHDKLFNRVKNTWDATNGTFSVKNLKFVTLPGYIFEFSMAHVNVSNASSFTKAISWPPQQWNNGPAEDWPPIPYGGKERKVWDAAEAIEPGSGRAAVYAQDPAGYRAQPGEWTTPFAAEVVSAEAVQADNGMNIIVQFSEPLFKGEYAFGFDTISDWNTSWNEAGDAMIVNVPAEAVASKAESAHMIIFRLMDLKNNLIAGPIELDIDFAELFAPKNYASLSFDGNIGLNFFLDLGAYEGVEKVEVTYCDPTKENDTPKTDVYTDFSEMEDGFFKVAAEAAPAQICKDITVAVYGADDEILYTNTLTIEDLLKAYIEIYAANDEIVALCQNYLTYAKYAQDYFYGESEIADDEILPIDNVTAADVAAYSTSTMDLNLNDGFAYKAMTFSCRSNTVMRYAFSGAKADVEYTAEFVAGGEGMDITVTTSGSQVIVNVSGIAAAQLDDEYMIAVFADGVEVIDLSSSPLAYVKAVLNNASASEELVNLAKAIYNYSVAANAYFAPVVIY